MATPADVVDLLADVRTGSSIERARAAASAFRALGSLTAAQKRELAVMVAERAAPQLVPRIQAETGLDLTREQVQAVIDMAGRMEPEDIDELRHTLRDEEARGDALRAVGTSAAAAAADASGLDDVVGTPDRQAEDQPEEALPAPGGQDPPVPPDPAEPDRPDLAVDEAELEALGVESELLDLDLEPEPTSPVAPAPEPREFVSIFDDLPTLPAFEQRAEGRTMTPDRTGTRLEDLDTADLTTRVRATQQPLVERLRQQATAAGCVRVVRAHLDDVADMEAVGRTAVVDAVPDGWARRRALQAMLEADVLPSAEVPDLLRRVGRPVARAWLCATAIETGVLDVDELGGLLDARAATRLSGRYG